MFHSLLDSYDQVVGSQGGKGGGTYAAHGYNGARPSYSQAGNYRWRLFVRCKATGGDFVAELALEPTRHKPVETIWPATLED